MKLKIPIKYKVWFNQMPLSILKNQDGVTAVLVAIVAAMLLGFTALAIDVGYMYSTRNELQNAADAAALAGAGELGRIYLSMDPSDQATYNVDDPPDGINGISDINEAAINVAFNNNAAGDSIVISAGDIEIGQWQWDVPDLNAALDTTTTVTPDAVRVTVKREGDNAVSTFFAKILSVFGGDHESFAVSAVATAALSGPVSVDEGVLKTPFGISEDWILGDDPCPDPVIMNTSEDCAGWHNFFDTSNVTVFPTGIEQADLDAANSKRDQKCINLIMGSEVAVQNGSGYDVVDDEGNIVIDVDAGEKWLLEHFPSEFANSDSIDWTTEAWPETTPETKVGMEFEFTEGVTDLITNPNSSDYLLWNDSVDTDGDRVMGDELLASADPVDPDNHSAQGKAISPLAALFDFYRFRDNDGKNAVWTATVPVYKDDTDCGQLGGDPIEIVGFAEIVIHSVNTVPDKNISVSITCELHPIKGRSGGGISNTIGDIPSLVQ